MKRETADFLEDHARALALVYWDDLVMLFLHRRLDPQEFLYVFPEDPRATLGRAAGDRESFLATWAEVERSLSSRPGRIAGILRSELEKIRSARGW